MCGALVLKTRCCAAVVSHTWSVAWPCSTACTSECPPIATVLAILSPAHACTRRRRCCRSPPPSPAPPLLRARRFSSIPSMLSKSNAAAKQTQYGMNSHRGRVIWKSALSVVRRRQAPVCPLTCTCTWPHNLHPGVLEHHSTFHVRASVVVACRSLPPFPHALPTCPSHMPVWPRRRLLRPSRNA